MWSEEVAARDSMCQSLLLEYSYLIGMILFTTPLQFIILILSKEFSNVQNARVYRHLAACGV
jgi:hypothetical protein